MPRKARKAKKKAIKAKVVAKKETGSKLLQDLKDTMEGRRQVGTMFGRHVRIQEVLVAELERVERRAVSLVHLGNAMTSRLERKRQENKELKNKLNAQKEKLKMSWEEVVKEQLSAPLKTEAEMTAEMTVKMAKVKGDYEQRAKAIEEDKERVVAESEELMQSCTCHGQDDDDELEEEED